MAIEQTIFTVFLADSNDQLIVAGEVNVVLRVVDFCVGLTSSTIAGGFYFGTAKASGRLVLGGIMGDLDSAPWTPKVMNGIAVASLLPVGLEGESLSFWKNGGTLDTASYVTYERVEVNPSAI